MPAWLHPGRSARAVIDGATVGYFGQLHPAEAQRRKLKQMIFVGEIYLDRLYKQNLRQPVVRELSRFQAVRRDFSFILAKSTPWARIAEALTALGIPEAAAFRSSGNPERKRIETRPCRTYLAAAADGFPGARPHAPGRRTARLHATRRRGHGSSGRKIAQLNLSDTRTSRKRSSSIRIKVVALLRHSRAFPNFPLCKTSYTARRTTEFPPE